MRTAFAVLSLALATSLALADDSLWSSHDYVDFYYRHYNGHVPLPHLRDETQKDLFRHLTDPGKITRIQRALSSAP